MALTLTASGTHSNTTSTETDLATVTAAGVYVLVVDGAALVNGETLTLRIYSKCLSGGTERLTYSAAYLHAQGEPIKLSVPVPSDISLRATIQETRSDTTTRSYPWKVLAL